jgi:hypothetical protein
VPEAFPDLAEALEPPGRFPGLADLPEVPGRFPGLAAVPELPEPFGGVFGPEAESFVWRLPWPGALLEGRVDVRFLSVMRTICCFTTVMS